MKKQLYFKNKNIFNAECRQFGRISILVYNTNCSLHFHNLGIDNVCEGNPEFQAITGILKYLPSALRNIIF
jgi:hypothetical protein